MLLHIELGQMGTRLKQQVSLYNPRHRAGNSLDVKYTSNLEIGASQLRTGLEKTDLSTQSMPIMQL
jgi:hypothetical protein